MVKETLSTDLLTRLDEGCELIIAVYYSGKIIQVQICRYAMQLFLLHGGVFWQDQPPSSPTMAASRNTFLASCLSCQDARQLWIVGHLLRYARKRSYACASPTALVETKQAVNMHVQVVSMHVLAIWWLGTQPWGFKSCPNMHIVGKGD